MPAPHGRRFHVPGVPSPSLVVDRDVLDRNLSAMADHARHAGIALRPHAKTHKCPAIAQRQLAAGAVGLTVATLGEAEVFAEAGVDDLFVAYPLWAGDDTGARLDALVGRTRLSVGADSLAGLARLRHAVRRPGALTVLVEVDCGLRRTGVPPADAPSVALGALDAGFAFGGVFTFPGHAYAPRARDAAVADEAKALAEAGDALAAAGLTCTTLSGGSTPTAAATGAGVLNELRPGVYALNDAQQVELGTCRREDVALCALGTVVSAPADGRVVLDAGAKVLGPDRPAWMPGHGLVLDRPGARVAGLWEHHTVLDLTDTPAPERPTVGDRVAVAPNHVCTAVNLATELWVVSTGELADRWEVRAAGRNR